MQAEPRSWRSGLALCLAVTLLAAFVRATDDRCLNASASGAWFTSDPDTLYHVRRVARALEDGRVAPTDEALNHPFGSPIPWPPYYTELLGAVLGPFAPPANAAARRQFLEQRVASAPLVFGALTSAVVAGLGFALAGLPGGLFAGVYHALCDASLAYSKLGNGDHHAWIALLWIAVLGLLATAAAGDGLSDRRRCAVLGSMAGLLTGLALGSWVAALILVVWVDVALGVFILAQVPRARPGLGTWAITFHAAALVSVWPAVLASPWRRLEPFDVVNLSWFHASYLALGLGVVLPLPLLRSPAARKRYPLAVVVALAMLGAVLFATDLAAGRALREGFDWAAKTNEFMSRVGESRSLFETGFAAGLDYLGYGLLLLPLALGWAAYGAWRGRLELVPFCVAGLFGIVQASRQMRFADVLAPTLAVLAAGLLGAVRVRWAPRVPGWAAAAAGLLLAAGLNFATVERIGSRLGPDGVRGTQLERPARLAVRAACEWLRTAVAEPGAVLASWRFGHVIEWAADRPSVATNFGLYVGAEGFRAPAVLFMTEEPAAAEQLLIQRDVRFVLVSSELPGELHALIETAVPESFGRYATFTGPRGGKIEEPWFRTFGARLLFGGEVLHGEPAPAIDFLRLVYRSARSDPGAVGGPQPAAQVWERVRGAHVVARGAPGSVLRVEVRLRHAPRGRLTVWHNESRADAEGRAVVRVPYATQSPNGQGRVEHAAWSLGERTGALVIRESAVRAGSVVALD